MNPHLPLSSIFPSSSSSLFHIFLITLILFFLPLILHSSPFYLFFPSSNLPLISLFPLLLSYIPSLLLSPSLPLLYSPILSFLSILSSTLLPSPLLPLPPFLSSIPSPFFSPSPISSYLFYSLPLSPFPPRSQTRATQSLVDRCRLE